MPAVKTPKGEAVTPTEPGKPSRRRSDKAAEAAGTPKEKEGSDGGKEKKSRTSTRNPRKQSGDSAKTNVVKADEGGVQSKKSKKKKKKDVNGGELPGKKQEDPVKALLADKSTTGTYSLQPMAMATNDVQPIVDAAVSGAGVHGNSLHERGSIGAVGNLLDGAHTVAGLPHNAQIGVGVGVPTAVIGSLVAYGVYSHKKKKRQAREKEADKVKMNAVDERIKAIGEKRTAALQAERARVGLYKEDRDGQRDQYGLERDDRYQLIKRQGILSWRTSRYLLDDPEWKDSWQTRAWFKDEEFDSAALQVADELRRAREADVQEQARHQRWLIDNGFGSLRR